MYGNGKQGRIRPLGAYLLKVIKFYDVKNERLTPLVFVLILAVNFMANLIAVRYVSDIQITTVQVPVRPEELAHLLQVLLVVNGLNLGSYILTSLFTSAYLYAYIRDLRGIPYSFRECWRVLGRKVFAIILLSVINVLAIVTGLFLLIVPGIIIYLMFVFSNCYMMDRNQGIMGSLKNSLDLTNGHKSQIFSVMVFFNLLIIILSALQGFGEGPLITLFISAFISAIVNLMYQRLTALMYVDLEYPYLRMDEVEQ